MRGSICWCSEFWSSKMSPEKTNVSINAKHDHDEATHLMKFTRVWQKWQRGDKNIIIRQAYPAKGEQNNHWFTCYYLITVKAHLTVAHPRVPHFFWNSTDELTRPRYWPKWPIVHHVTKEYEFVNEKMYCWKMKYWASFEPWELHACSATHCTQW